MAEDTKIEWATHTFNPWIGCTEIRDVKTGAPSACDHCYARELAHRYGWAEWGDHPRHRTSAANWKKPLHWARVAAKAKAEAWADLQPAPERPRVFCASLADVFDNQVPQEWRQDLLELIAATPELDWMLLTKRPQNIAKMSFNDFTPFRNVWLGITAENQTEYNRRWSVLQGIPAAVHFVSYEPALGPLRLTGPLAEWRWPPTMVICGGEDRARPGRPTNHEFLIWARELRDECQKVGVDFFFKQTVGKGEIPADLMVREMPEAA